MALALTALRLRLADLVRNHDNRDSQGRFTPTGRDNLTHQPLTHEQHAAAIAALDKTKGRGTGICDVCTKLLNGPRKGQHLGIVPIIKGAHYNDAYCPSHMHQTLHTFYRNRGMSDAQAHQRAEAQVRAGWSADDLATLSYTPTPTPETEHLRIRIADALRRHRSSRHASHRSHKGRHTTKRRPRKAKVKSLKAHLSKLKATVPQPKLPDVAIIHGAQGKIIDNIGSGMTKRLAGLSERLARLATASETRGWDVAYDEGKHPRGPNGRYIGGSGLKAHVDYMRMHDAIAHHKYEAKRIRLRGDWRKFDEPAHTTKQRAAQAKAYLASVTVDGHVGLPALQAQERVLQARLQDIARTFSPTDIQELQALHHTYQHRTILSTHTSDSDPQKTAQSEYARLSYEAKQIETLVAYRNRLVAADHKHAGLSGKPPRISLVNKVTQQAIAALAPATHRALTKHLDRLNAQAKIPDPEEVRRQNLQRIRAQLRAQRQAQAKAVMEERTRITIVPEVQRPSPTATTDVYGQHLPFTHTDFNAARATAVPIDPNQQGINAASFVTIAGTRYVLKTAIPNYFDTSELDQHRNEAAMGVAMRTLGLAHLSPPATYHLVGSDGRHYSLVAVVHGKPLADATYAETKLIAQRPLSEALLAEYVLGMIDRHGNNILLDPTTGAITEIDHGFAFSLDLTPSYSALYQVIEDRGRYADATMRPLSRAVAKTLLRSAAELATALAPYHLSLKEQSAITSRIAGLQAVYDAGTPITLGALSNV